MPASELVLPTVGILALIAVALLLAPAFAWARRQVIGSGAEVRDTGAERMQDPDALRKGQPFTAKRDDPRV